jgi:spermidine synthase
MDVVHVGGAGMTMPRWIHHTHPGSRSKVLELDPLVVEIAKDRLGWDAAAYPTIDVVIGDARTTLKDLPAGSADVVIGDAFNGVSVPWHLTTVEFLTAVRERLRPGGSYVMNLIDFPPHDFRAAQLATLRRVFEHVLVLAPATDIAGKTGGNHLLVASTKPIDSAELLRVARDRDSRELDVVDGAAMAGGADALTDDYAPVDQLLTPYSTG